MAQQPNSSMPNPSTKIEKDFETTPGSHPEPNQPDHMDPEELPEHQVQASIGDKKTSPA